MLPPHPFVFESVQSPVHWHRDTHLRGMNLPIVAFIQVSVSFLACSAEWPDICRTTTACCLKAGIALAANRVANIFMIQLCVCDIHFQGFAKSLDTYVIDTLVDYFVKISEMARRQLRPINSSKRFVCKPLQHTFIRAQFAR
jgi:hypothetical protein